MKSVPDVDAFTQDEIECMLKACTHSREADTFIRRKFAMRCLTAKRDQAIILILLDSGIQASEFSSLRVTSKPREESWIFVMEKKVVQKEARELAMLSGDIWRSEKTGIQCG